MRFAMKEEENLFIKMIDFGEWSLLDLKQYLWPINRNIPKKRDLEEFAADCSAIANSGGGLLIVGPPDDEKRETLPERKISQSEIDIFLNSLHDRTKPVLNVDVPYKIIYKNRETFIFEIPPARDIITCSGKIYFRQAARKKEILSDEIELFRGMITTRSNRPTELPQLYSQITYLCKFGPQEAIARILKEIRIILYRVQMTHSGGGWPGCSISGPEEFLKAISEKVIDKELQSKIYDHLKTYNVYQQRYDITIEWIYPLLINTLELMNIIWSRYKDILFID